MKNPKHLFDEKCLELAEHFLRNEGILTTPAFNAHAEALAWEIQQAVEDYCRYEIPEVAKAGGQSA